MKRIIVLLLIPIVGFSQNRFEAENKVHEGVALHDKGNFAEALLKYEDALNFDTNNLLALSEKAMTLNSSKRYQEAVEVCKIAIKTHPTEDVKNVYVTYASSLDHLNNTELALKIFDEGLKKFPKYYQLHFNKGITLVNSKKVEKAIVCFQNATRSNPNHASSYNALAVLTQQNRIPSILSSCRYLSIDNKSARAKGNLETVLKLMAQGVSQIDDNSISLSIDSGTLDNANRKKITENDFSSTDLILSMAAALDFDSKNADKSQCQKFMDKFETICQSMDEMKSKQKGYFWNFLAPYFIELEKNQLIEPFAYIVFLPSQTEDVVKYHKENPDKIKSFYDWSNGYKWN